MSRNFSNESWFNTLLRVSRAFRGRFRGRSLALLGVFAKGTSNSLYFGASPRFMNTKGIRLGANVSFGVFARIECHQNNGASFGIDIGENTSFGDYTHIGATSNISIGSNVLGGSNILIVDHSHGNPAEDMRTRNTIIPRLRPLSTKGPIRIENNVWIGDNAIILSGTKIGEGAIVAAGAIVAGEVPPYTIFFGRLKNGA